VDATTFGSLGLQNEVMYQGPNGSAGYDADGNVVSYQYRDAGGRVDQYAVTYLRKDSYLQSTTSGQNISNTPNVRPATDESVYDTRGNLEVSTPVNHCHAKFEPEQAASIDRVASEVIQLPQDCPSIPVSQPFCNPAINSANRCWKRGSISRALLTASTIGRN
jgi:hypothetical protein